MKPEPAVIKSTFKRGLYGDRLRNDEYADLCSEEAVERFGPIDDSITLAFTAEAVNDRSVAYCLDASRWVVIINGVGVRVYPTLACWLLKHNIKSGYVTRVEEGS